MKLLICGCRDHYLTPLEIARGIDASGITHASIDLLIHGGAGGVDICAGNWADLMNVKVSEYPADWKKHGRSAGPIRNRQMLELGQPDFVIAFWDGKSKGTKNMIDMTIQKGISLHVMPLDERKIDV